MYYTRGLGSGGLQNGDKRDLPLEGTALAAVRRVDWKQGKSTTTVCSGTELVMQGGMEMELRHPGDWLAGRREGSGYWA